MDGPFGVIIVILVLVGIVFGAFWAWPNYNVYQAEAAGRAQLAEADSNRRIRVLEAQASLDSAAMIAQAEVARAKGVAEANAIIADSLGGPEGYLRWRYIEMLEASNDNSIIYVPTEAGLPILEAGKREGTN